VRGRWSPIPVAVAAVALVPGRAAAAPVPTAQAPIVVAGVPVTLDQASARAGSKAGRSALVTALHGVARIAASERAR
jgi:hypothetical protein